MSETPMEPSAPPSVLFASARALTDFNLRSRTQGAILRKAKQVVAAGKAAAQPATSWNFALAVLQSPESLDPTMMALVAIDDAVAPALEIEEDGITVVTSAVTDAQITAAVNLVWNTVSGKYPA